MAALNRNEPWISSALTAIDDAVVKIVEAGIPHEKIMLLGFSQGACFMLEYAARNARRYGAVVGLSGGLLGPDFINRDYQGSLENTPVLLGSSELDTFIPKQRLDFTASTLQLLGGKVTKKVYSGRSHLVNHDEVNRARNMMLRILSGVEEEEEEDAD